MTIRWAWLPAALWAGLPVGLGLSRLLYEMDPLSFGLLGGRVAPVMLAVLLAAGVYALLHTLQPDPWSLVPAGVAWLYVFTPATQVDPLRGAVLVAGGVILAAALLILPRVAESPIPAWGYGAATGLMAFMAYVVTLQRTIGRADTFEFQVTAPVLGVAHPTGYPLYTILGGVFSVLPLGEVYTRVNLTSAVAGGIAVGLLAFFLVRVVQVRAPLAVLGALAFGLSPLFWSQAVVAEVYALHNAFTVAILGLALWIMVEPNDTPPGRVILLGALVGFSLTNHLTTVLILPAVALALIFARPLLTLREWAIAVGALVAPLLLYLYIPLRWPALHDGVGMPFGEFIAWVTGSRFSGALQLQAWLTDTERWRIMGRLLLDQYGISGAILAVVGLGGLLLREWRIAAVTALAFAGVLFYGLNYLVPDVGVFVLPLFMLAALCMAVGVDTAASLIEERAGLEPGATPDFAPSFAVIIALTAFALVPLSLMWRVAPTLEWADERALERWGREVLRLPLDENAVILADSEKIAPLEYLHRIEGQRPDLDMVVHGTEDEYLSTLFASIEAGRTVYLARFLPGLEGQFHLRSAGPLVEVGTEPLTELPAEAVEVGLEWGNGMVLAGYTVEEGVVLPGDDLGVTLYWTTDSGVDGPYQVNLSLFDNTGITVQARPSVTPVAGRYPTPAWEPGEIIPDYHSITIPYALAPGGNTLFLSVRPPFSEQQIPLLDGRTVEVPLTEVLGVITASGAPPVGERRVIRYENGSVLGFEAPPAIPNDGEATVEMLWQDTSGIYTRDYYFPEPDRVDLPVSTINPLVRLFLVSEQTDDTIAWRLEGAPMRCGWFLPLTPACGLGTTTVEDALAPEALARFDDLIALTGIDFPEGQIAPGQPLEVGLTWQGLRAITEDYTVSVQLIGPDGRVYGQSDMWPVQGTFPTSDWAPGETVNDRHTVFLSAEAPPGPYQIHVVLYLLSTNTRLPVVDEGGDPRDDKATFEGLFLTE